MCRFVLERGWVLESQVFGPGAGHRHWGISAGKKSTRNKGQLYTVYRSFTTERFAKRAIKGSGGRLCGARVLKKVLLFM